MARESPDYILHLGDRQSDAMRLEQTFPEIPMISVRGNCDIPVPGEQLVLLREFLGVRVLLTHGHVYHVKRGLLQMELAAREAEADVAVFGHTHQAFCSRESGFWLMNPGACGGLRPTYGVIRIEKGTAMCYTERAD